MLYDPLRRVRDQVRDYAPLSAYLLQHYSAPGRHFIGIPHGRSDQDCPWITYMLRSEQRTGTRRAQRLVIAWGIIQTGFEMSDPDVFVGPREICEIGELIIDGLRSNVTLGLSFMQVSVEIESLTDLNLRHPYYWGEMLVPVNHLGGAGR